MELRYIITSIIAIILLQLLLLNLTQSLRWLFNIRKRYFVLLNIFAYCGANGLILLNFTHTISTIRVVALILALLLFVLFSRFLTICISKIINRKRYENGLKLFFVCFFFGLVGLSIYNAYTPKIIHYSVQIDKPLNRPLKIGVASDLHLGYLFGNKQLDELANIFNQTQVDIILLPGDIMDDNTDAYLAENMPAHLAKLHAPLGVYATLGNHDFFGKNKEIKQEIEKAGIHVLYDESIKIDEQFILIGRNDELHQTRPKTSVLLSQINTNLPIFLMDHRPTEIIEHSQLPIDIQVSGHTHKGQIFPMNIVIDLMYELGYGYKKINQGHFFVTSGYGFWGIPMRLGSQSEVFIIDVIGK